MKIFFSHLIYQYASTISTAASDQCGWLFEYFLFSYYMSTLFNQPSYCHWPWCLLVSHMTAPPTHPLLPMSNVVVSCWQYPSLILLKIFPPLYFCKAHHDCLIDKISFFDKIYQCYLTTNAHDYLLVWVTMFFFHILYHWFISTHIGAHDNNDLLVDNFFLLHNISKCSSLSAPHYSCQS